MKTRVVYPQLWLDEQFALCKMETKFLFMYLITNQSLGLSRYTRISDRKISFDTGLNSVQITTAKAELESLKWCYFQSEWVYHNHKCAFVDYAQNKRVEESKQNEINAVPSEIVAYFNSICLNKVETELEPSSNLIQKSKIKNEGGVGETTKPQRKESSQEYLAQIPDTDKAELLARFDLSEKQLISKAEDLLLYCNAHGKRYKNYKAFLCNALKKDFKPRKLIVSHVNGSHSEVIVPISPDVLKKLKEETYARIGRSP